MKIARIALILAFLCSAVFSAQPASARLMQAEDLFKFSLLAGAQISPDGRWVVVERQRLNPQKDLYESTLLLVDAATGATRDVTKGLHDGGAAWMPDSRGFAFVRPGKDKKPQIFSYRLRDGKIAQLTHAKDGAAGAVYSHDASPAWGWYERLGLLAHGHPDSGHEEAGVAASKYAIVIHEKHFNRHDYLIWKSYGKKRMRFLQPLKG